MSSSTPFVMSPKAEVLTFKQKGGESLNDAWSRIFNAHEKTEPKLKIGIRLRTFYLGICLCYRLVLDTLVGGDFLIMMLMMLMKL